MSLEVQSSKLSKTHLDPYIFVYDQKTKQVVSQIFNFIDVIGGKSLVNAEQIEKFLAIRGIL